MRAARWRGRGGFTVEGEGGRWEVVRAGDGSPTVRDVVRGETYHPELGMMEECRVWVRQEDVRLRWAGVAHPCAWDVGMGAGGVTAALLAEPGLRGGEVVSFECDAGALETVLAREHDFPHLGVPGVGWWKRRWHEEIIHLPERKWRLVKGEVERMLFEEDVPLPEVVIFDMHSPASQPELWTLEFWTRMWRRLEPKACVVAFHTRSTAVRATLLRAGFWVGRGVALGSKEETTLAANRSGILGCPLGREWLERLRRSTARWPLGECGEVGRAEWLEPHPQFRR